MTRAHSRASWTRSLADAAVASLADDEIDLFVELHNAIDPQLPTTAAGVRRGREHEPTLVHLVARLEGRPVGVAFCLEQGDLRSTDVAVAFFGVLDEFRGRGIGSSLYAAVSRHARSIGKARLQCDVWEDETAGVDFLGRRGFVEAERFARVRLDLREAPRPRAASPPPGVEILPLAHCLDLVERLFVVAREGADDMPSADPIEFTYDEWRSFEIDRETVRHDLSHVALVDGDPIGFGPVYVVGDSREGWHNHTAVLRRWRRRGVATAIKLAQIRAARAAGLEGLTTFSELRNVPMRTLNERLGYRPLPDQIRMRGPLAG